MLDTQTYWQSFAQTIDFPSRMWIDGQSSESGAAKPIDLISPRDGSVLLQLPGADAGDVDHAVAGARAAFERGSWSRASAKERGRVLQRWADLIVANADELALLISLEMGKPITAAREVEVPASAATFRWYGELSDKLLDQSPRGLPDSIALVTREPIGVVGAITPWNMPLTLVSWKLAAALVVGNSVVVKPAAQSPLSTLVLARLGSEAGLPDGVLQVLLGSGSEAGSALALNNDVDCLTFTGSPGTGKQLLQYSGQSNAKPVWLELGGKTPFIVLPDADLDAAADMVAWGITFNSGQLCTAASRLIVHSDIATELTRTVIERIEKRTVGDPLDPATEIGPLASERHRKDVLAKIDRGLEEGATIASGTGRGPDGKGWYLDPVVFTGVTPAMSLAQDEIFGPVLSVLTVNSSEEAIHTANDSSFGLGASLWTSDLSTAHSMARSINSGMVWVNCFEEGDMSVPFGGRKLSGHGADKSIHGIDKFTSLKTTWIKL